VEDRPDADLALPSVPSMLSRSGDGRRTEDSMSRARANDFAVAHLKRMVALIERHGWAVQGVTCGGRGRPEFAYTVGLLTLGEPEFIIFGAPFGAACGVLDDLAARVRDGARYTHGQVLDDVIAPQPVVLLEVADTTQHLLIAQQFAAAEPVRPRQVRAWQVVYPDDDGRWPWQPGFAVPDLPILGLIPEGV